MIAFRNLAIYAVAVVGVTGNCIGLSAQATSENAQSPSISVSITLRNNHVTVGEKLIGDLTVKNISDQNLCVSTRGALVHIEGKDGEPPKTEYYRHLLGDFRPGDGPEQTSGLYACQSVAPRIGTFDGMSTTFHFDLNAYYNLSVPGEYSVYIEFPDIEPKGETGLLIPTPKVNFELEAKKQ